MTKWLHTNDFRYKKAHAVPAKADKVQQNKFVAFYKKLSNYSGGSMYEFRRCELLAKQSILNVIN